MRINFLIVFFVGLMPSLVWSAEKSYIYTCSGNAIDSEIEMYIEVSATVANSNNLTGNFDVTNAKESLLSIDIPKSPAVAHKWFIGKTSHAGVGYIQFHSVRGDTLIVNSPLACSPYVNPLSVSFSKEISFIIGALTVITFGMAFLTVSRSI